MAGGRGKSHTERWPGARGDRKSVAAYPVRTRRRGRRVQSRAATGCVRIGAPPPLAGIRIVQQQQVGTANRLLEPLAVEAEPPGRRSARTASTCNTVRATATARITSDRSAAPGTSPTRRAPAPRDSVRPRPSTGATPEPPGRATPARCRRWAPASEAPVGRHATASSKSRRSGSPGTRRSSASVVTNACSQRETSSQSISLGAADAWRGTSTGGRPRAHRGLRARARPATRPAQPRPSTGAVAVNSRSAAVGQ